MINILIKDNDVLYRQGMTQYLSELFLERYGESLVFTGEFTRENVSQADIIVIELSPGESYTCIPELQYRKSGILIGLVAQPVQRLVPLTLCASDIAFINRSASLNEIRHRVIALWDACHLGVPKAVCSSCFSCNHRELSPQQIRIMASIYGGKRINEIAEELHISDKTIFSHKYMVMNKFNLTNDFELLAFLNKLKSKKTIPNAFRDCLVQYSLFH